MSFIPWLHRQDAYRDLAHDAALAHVHTLAELALDMDAQGACENAERMLLDAVRHYAAEYPGETAGVPLDDIFTLYAWAYEAGLQDLPPTSRERVK